MHRPFVPWLVHAESSAPVQALVADNSPVLPLLEDEDEVVAELDPVLDDDDEAVVAVELDAPALPLTLEVEDVPDETVAVLLELELPVLAELDSVDEEVPLLELLVPPLLDALDVLDRVDEEVVALPEVELLMPPLVVEDSDEVADEEAALLELDPLSPSALPVLADEAVAVEVEVEVDPLEPPALPVPVDDAAPVDELEVPDELLALPTEPLSQPNAFNSEPASNRRMNALHLTMQRITPPVESTVQADGVLSTSRNRVRVRGPAATVPPCITPGTLPRFPRQ